MKDLLEQMTKASSRQEGRMLVMQSIHTWFQENNFKPLDASRATYEMVQSFLAAPNVRFSAEVDIKKIWKKTRGMFDWFELICEL